MKRQATMMDDRIRISDADRERVTARLRDHFAEGRLTSEELEERITAALSAKTFGDLRRIMADLPEPALVPPPSTPSPPWVGRPGALAWRGPRILPLAIIALVAALVIPGVGWVFFAFLKVMLVLWLVTCLAGIFAAARFRRRLRRHWQDNDRQRHDGDWPPQDGNWPQWHQWRQYQWRG
jgi:hypothetical protein